MNKGIIGIVGGMGPEAGLDLSSKIVSQTIASKDQEHLPQILVSIPEIIGDRSDYILGKTARNPAYNIVEIILKLESAGVTIACLACNSAHAPPIFDVIKHEMAARKSSVRLVHIIDATGRFIKEHYPKVKRAGILCTSGSYQANLYAGIARYGPAPVNLSPDRQEEVHESIYHPRYGIKSCSGLVSDKSKSLLAGAADFLREKGSEAIILGCTELSLVFRKMDYKGTPLIDSSLALARGLIRLHSPDKLKPLRLPSPS